MLNFYSFISAETMHLHNRNQLNFVFIICIGYRVLFWFVPGCLGTKPTFEGLDSFKGW